MSNVIKQREDVFQDNSRPQSCLDAQSRRGRQGGRCRIDKSGIRAFSNPTSSTFPAIVTAR